ncbi:hypothetical protein DIPPA_23451 [Diplonema papillatum]|nr:hypothetical protein DIPPA_23451 [Diplonema papillatum]
MVGRPASLDLLCTTPQSALRQDRSPGALGPRRCFPEAPTEHERRKSEKSFFRSSLAFGNAPAPFSPSGKASSRLPPISAATHITPHRPAHPATNPRPFTGATVLSPPCDSTTDADADAGSTDYTSDLSPRLSPEAHPSALASLSTAAQRQQAITPLVQLLFALQAAGDNKLLTKLTSKTTVDIDRALEEHNFQDMCLTRSRFQMLLETMLEADDLDDHEVDIAFSLFDTDDSKTVDPTELKKGLGFLRSSDTSELMLRRIHHMLSLSNRCSMPLQYITRFDLQLLLSALTDFWSAHHGEWAAEMCGRELDALLDSCEWDRARVPAEELRQKIFASSQYTRLFCLGPDREPRRFSLAPSSPFPFQRPEPTPPAPDDLTPADRQVGSLPAILAGGTQRKARTRHPAQITRPWK